MKMRGLCAAILWLTAAYPCAAQLMSPSEYRDYMKGLDAAANRWQKQIKAIDVDKMNVDYSSGKTIEHARETVLENLKLMRSLIEKQRSTEVLSVDILIEDALGDASGTLSDLQYLLATRQPALSAIGTEMADLQIQLRKHIDVYADKLQLEAAGCSK